MGIINLVSVTVWIWLIVTIVFVVGELLTVGLTSIWFAAGALCAMVAAMFNAPIPVQIIVFLLVSLIALLATRPWARKYINSKAKETNANAIIGQTIIIAEDVSNRNQTGMAVVNGQEWTIRSVDDLVEIKAGEKAVVTEISGVKLIARKVEGKMEE